MNLIAAVDQNWGIGNGGELLVHIPDDMKFFRQVTMGKAVVMGRKTFEGLPGGILKGRANIILTHDGDYQAAGAVIARSLAQLRQELAKYPSEDIFVIGGGSVYRQLLDECDTAYITKIDFAYCADTYFPNLDEREGWAVTQESEEQTYFDLVYHYLVYEKMGDLSGINV